MVLPSLPFFTNTARLHSKPSSQSESHPKCFRSLVRFFLKLNMDQVMGSLDRI